MWGTIPKKKALSGQSLFVALSRQEAMILAKLIRDLAKEQGWPDLPADAKRTRMEVPPTDKLS